MRIVMMVLNPCTNDARVTRQAEALASAGHAVTVLATWKTGMPHEEEINGVHYFRPGESTNFRTYINPPGRGGLLRLLTRPRKFFERFAVIALRGIAHKILGRSLEALLRSRQLYLRPLKEIRPDVVHAHELHTLLVGWLYSSRAGVPLIYDSHELEVGRNGRFLWHEKRLRHLVERFLIRRCAAVITVCDSIADYLRELYRIERPLVVHNAPEVLATNIGRDVKNSLGLTSESPLAVYVGNVTSNRGVEAGVQALARMPSLHLALVGPRNPQISALVAALATQLGVASRLHLVDPVPHEEVTSFIRTADLSLVLIQNTCLSYAMCFPNKLLESLLARVPVIASDLIELRRIVGETGGGLVVDQTDIDAIQRAIQQVLSDRARFVPGEQRLEAMMLRYGWATQRARLLALYETLGSPGSAMR